MHALIVHCHPEPRSFIAALKDVAVDTLQRLGHTVEVSDLYAEGFDPVEGPAHYAKRTDPDYFSALTEQRHASKAGTLPPRRSPRDRAIGAGRIGGVPVPHVVARATGHAEGLARPRS